MSIVKTLANGLKDRRPATTLQIHSSQHMGDTIRVVASFNRQPKSDELAALLEQAYGNKLTVVPKSFRVRSSKDNMRVVVAGFMIPKTQKKPLKEAASFKEVASNVYMDPSDNSIWATQNGEIIRQASESLSELASVAPVVKSVNRPVEMALASVKEFVGPVNTQVVAFVDPAKPQTVGYGYRISDDQVWSEKAGIVEVSQDMVVDTQNLNGADHVSELAAAVNTGDAQKMIDYYTEVFKYDPAYLAQVISIIEGRAV